MPKYTVFLRFFIFNIKLLFLFLNSNVFFPTYIFYNKIINFMEDYSLLCLKKKQKKKKKKKKKICHRKKKLYFQIFIL